MTDANVICIKWGTAFGPEEVNRLYRSARRHTARNLRFFCLTDYPDGLESGIIPLALTRQPFEDRIDAVRENTRKRGLKLRKIAMFRPGLIEDLNGPLVALDIDVAIVGPLDPLFDHAPDDVLMARPFSKTAKVKTLGEGSVLRFDPAKHPFLYTAMAENPEAMTIRAQGSEQTYTSQVAQDHGVLTHFPDPWVVSFKYHCRPKRPLNLIQTPQKPHDARIVCFHGQPSVEEAVEGYRAGLFKSTLPAPWLVQG